jgi:hypothetical protein
VGVASTAPPDVDTMRDDGLSQFHLAGAVSFSYRVDGPNSLPLMATAMPQLASQWWATWRTGPAGSENIRTIISQGPFDPIS